MHCLGSKAGQRCVNTARHLFRAGPVLALRSEAAEYDGPGHLREKPDYAMPVTRAAVATPSRSLLEPASPSINQHAR